jgi:hypothetical protein
MDSTYNTRGLNEKCIHILGVENGETDHLGNAGINLGGERFTL